MNKIALLFGLLAASVGYGAPGISGNAGGSVNTQIVGNTVQTNQLFVTYTATKLYGVLGMNNSGSTEYIQIYNTVTPSANVTISACGFPGASGTYTIDISAGAGVQVANSDFTLDGTRGLWNLLYKGAAIYSLGAGVPLPNGQSDPASSTGPAPLPYWTYSTNAVLPAISFQVPALQPFYIDFSAYGLDLSAVYVCSSSTMNTRTLTTANTTLQAIIRAR
jgi:hypothetical protein